MTVPHWKNYLDQIIAAEISTLSPYFDEVIQVMPPDHDSGNLLRKIKNSTKHFLEDNQPLPHLQTSSENSYQLFLLNGTLNHHLDIQDLLQSLGKSMNRRSRLVAVLYNPYLRWVYDLANLLKIRTSSQPTTFITRTDLANLAKLAGFEITRIRPCSFIPFRLLGLGNWINRIMPMIPLLRWLSFSNFIVLRPLRAETTQPSLSIIIPARNEKGNIEAALQRMPNFLPGKLEIIFVEGHSNDGTWEEIQRVMPLYQDKFIIKAYKQDGKGKSNAVRKGFAEATQDLLTILDADLTVTPEVLPRFYEAYCKGLADFINGSRLVYPLEGNAMKFLNLLGNIFFSKALSNVLDIKIGDSLCGTKLFHKNDYSRMLSWRQNFGEFDPFGDYELLFPAAVFGLGIMDLPIYYRSRIYGTTNISRFRHGWMLLKMTIIGLFRIKLGKI